MTAPQFLDPGLRLAALSKALGHPARLVIVRYLLARRARCTCREIARQLPLAQSTVSRHLAVLCEAGWLRAAPLSGPPGYHLDRDVVAEFRRLVSAL